MEANDVHCYVCYEGETEEKKYAVEPCACKGSIRIHEECVLMLWSSRVCGVCKGKWKKPRVIILSRPKEYRDGLELKTTIHTDHIKQVYTIDTYGKKHGQWTQYDRFGVMMAQCNYVHGMRQGLFQEWASRWDANGNQVLMLQCNYVDNKRHGLFEIYDSNKDFRHVLEKAYYVNGKLEGERLEYDMFEYTGKWKKCHYQNGELHGDYEEYAHGRLIKMCGYLHGKLHGPYYEEKYDYNAHPTVYLIQECNYHCGKLEGVCTIYNKLRDKTLIPYEESFYIGGKLHGVVKEYNRVDGSLVALVYNKNGKMHGPYYRFQHGVLVEFQMRDHGKAHGEFLLWDAEGNLKSRTAYVYGEKVKEGFA